MKLSYTIIYAILLIYILVHAPFNLNSQYLHELNRLIIIVTHMVDPIKIIISFLNKIITSIKYIVELLAEGVERVGWKGRNLIVPLINLWLLSIIIPGIRETIKRFRFIALKQKIMECQAGALATYGYAWDETNPPTTEMLEPYFKLKNNIDLGVKFLCLLLVAAIAFEIISRFLNTRLQKKMFQEASVQEGGFTLDSYKYIITVFDRLFASCIYLYPLIEAFQRYSEGLFVFQPELQRPILTIFGPLLDWYMFEFPKLTFRQGPTLLFFFIFYGLTRNRTGIKYFIRYHATQALLIHCFNLFLSEFLQFGLGIIRAASWWYSTTYFVLVCCVLVIVPAMIACLMGIETRLPFLDEAILIHIGERPKDGRART